MVTLSVFEAISCLCDSLSMNLFIFFFFVSAEVLPLIPSCPRFYSCVQSGRVSGGEDELR